MKAFLTVFFLFAVSFLHAQTFSGPESVEYDSTNNRWLVGQHSSGKVLVYNPSTATLNNFCSGMSSGPYGIEILGGVLYCCDGSAVKGFDLGSGALVFNLNVGASFLNGITSDGNNFLFLTDYSAKKIYRVNVSANTFNVMATTVKSPNGIIYDGANNRCVFVTWGASAPIQAISLSDSTISTLFTTTLSNCDGITRDLQGNYYISAWGNSALNKTDSSFSANPVAVKTGLSSPADLGINSAGDSIGIPNSGSLNNVVFYSVPNSTGISEVAPGNITLFPNPASSRITITIDNPVINGTIELLDMQGKIVDSGIANGLVFFIDSSNLPRGNYLVRISNKNETLFSKQLLLQ
jgi:hypothetical protein